MAQKIIKSLIYRTIGLVVRLAAGGEQRKRNVCEFVEIQLPENQLCVFQTLID